MVRVFLNELLPVRFVALTAHGCVLVSYYFLKVDCIQGTLEPISRRYTRAMLQKDYRKALMRVEIVLMWSWACFIIEYAGLFSAYSLTWPRATLYNCVAHACGAFFVLWAQLDAWPYQTAEDFFLLFTLCPALLELLIVSLCAARHWIELHADSGDPPNAPSKVPCTEVQLAMIIGAIVLGVVGLPLAVRFVYRSVETDRLLGVAAWFGLLMSSTSLVLALVLANQKLRIVDPRFSSPTASHVLRQQGRSASETEPLREDHSE